MKDEQGRILTEGLPYVDGFSLCPNNWDDWLQRNNKPPRIRPKKHKKLTEEQKATPIS